MPIGEGTSLGVAHGRITIDAGDLLRAQRTVAQAAAAIQHAMEGVDASTKKTQSSFAGLTNAAKEWAGALGIGLGVAGVVQFARFTVEVDALATAYRRQQVAAVSLAGSQQKLNELLRVYDTATGGAIDKATALDNVTKLQAVGFADTAEELNQFARSIRGISIAMGATQDTVTQNLILELFTQRGARLDQLGLQYDKVRKRADELRAADASLTEQQAYQNAVLEQAEERFGKLADSLEGQSTGAEKAAKAWKELRLQLGGANGGVVDGFMAKLAENIDNATLSFRRLSDAIEGYKRQVAALGNLFVERPTGPQPFFNSFAVGSGGSFGSSGSSAPTAATPRFTEDQTNLIVERQAAIAEIERNALEARADAVEQYGAQMASAERNYGKTVAREAEDFARQRLRAEQAFSNSILEIRQDAARREADQAADLARMIGEARADSAERRTEWEEDHSKRIADIRQDAAERLTELEENYQRNRQRAAEDHSDKLMDAAGRLDARAVYEEQRNFARQEKDAKEAYDKQREDLQEQLQERIDQENESYAERLEDEAKALDKRIRQANEAAERQLQEAREADERRIMDMTADFEERKRLEDEDRAIRLQRMAIDHADQMAEMARQHALNLQQIAEQEADERTKLEEEFQKEMAALDFRIGAYAEKVRQFETTAIASFDRVYGHILARMAEGIGPMPLSPMIGAPGTFPSMGGNGRNRSVTVAPGAISPGAVVVYGAIGQSEETIGRIVVEQLTNILEQWTN